MEKILYDKTLQREDRNILWHELELKWLKLLQTPHPFGFYDNIYQEDNKLRQPKIDFCSFWYSQT